MTTNNISMGCVKVCIVAPHRKEEVKTVIVIFSKDGQEKNLKNTGDTVAVIKRWF